MDTALALIIPAVLGLATGAAATAYKSRKDLEVQYDIKLREERIAAWSRSTREPYFDLQRALGAVAKTAGESHEELPDSTAEALNRLGSRLRTSTTDDVETRVDPLLHAPRSWRTLGRRSQALVTVSRTWRFTPEPCAGWRVRVLNQSRSRVLRLDRVWLKASGETVADAMPGETALPRTLYPRESWQGFVADEAIVMHEIRNPFRAGRAKGPGWEARSRATGDPPTSPIPPDPSGKHATG